MGKKHPVRHGGIYISSGTGIMVDCLVPPPTQKSCLPSFRIKIHPEILGKTQERGCILNLKSWVEMDDF